MEQDPGLSLGSGGQPRACPGSAHAAPELAAWAAERRGLLPEEARSLARVHSGLWAALLFFGEMGDWVKR